MAHILIVDDEPGIRMAVGNLLEIEGHKVQTIDNGQAAVDNYVTGTFDLIFMDISMQKLNGITATKRIIKQDPSAKIIILTAMASKEMVLKAIHEGAKGYIIKPFDHQTLINVLEKQGIHSIKNSKEVSNQNILEKS